MKKILGALGASLVGVTMAWSAQASVYQLGNVSGQLQGGSNAVAGAFSDKIYFDVTSPAYGAFSIQDVPVSVSIPGVGTLQVLNIDNLSMTLVGPQGGQTLLGSGDLISSNQMLDAGQNWYLQVSGDANGSAGGRYTYAFVTRTVPEPATLPLVLGGAALMGWVLRRRASR